jgi:Carboxypeptidase C (cathepsin A)
MSEQEPATHTTPTTGPQPPARPLPQETTVTTEHSIELDGHELAYRATLSTLHIDTEKVSPAASVFSAAFTLLPNGENPDPARPITFVFNGGPGSSSTFLLMGSVAPKRIVTPDATLTPPAPYTLVDNAYTLLPVTDLVFIDAPGAGFSQIAQEAKPELWSTDGDVKGFVQFIRRYLSANGRWNSPKYVLGESYGTTRGAALALALHGEEIALNGLALLSCILDYGPHTGVNDQGYVGYFPTYAAIAHRHGKAGAGRSLEEHLKQAREFATGEYRQALAAGSGLSEERRQAVAQRYADFTGLDAAYVLRSDLRITDERFRKELLRNEQKVVGRYDGRVAGYDIDGAAEAETFVVDDAFVSPGYGSLVNAYLRDELKWKDTTERREFAGFDWASTEPGKGWVWKHQLPRGTKVLGGMECPYPLVIPDLASAMVRNPNMKVLVASGYFDLATPFFQTEQDITHLGVPAPLQANVTFTYYQAGHMVYTAPSELAKFAHDLTAFFDVK